MPLMPKGSYVLEIGSGAGWQAAVLSQKGFEVEAIDIEQSSYSAQRVWPVRDYDGVHIPFADNSFDFVFSSNVLEHIPHIEQFQAEIKRVLKPGGIAIHILPTGVWRFWTNVTFYPVRMQQFLSMLFSRLSQKNTNTGRNICGVKQTEQKRNSDNILKKIRHLIIPAGHGVSGSCISQLYLFSRFRWLKMFRRTGFSIQNCYPNRLFYTGHLLCGSLFTIRFRHWLSYLMGSSCLIYVLIRDGEPESG